MDYKDLSNLLIRISGLLIIVYTIVNIPHYFIGYYSAQNFFGNQASDLIAFLSSVVAPVIFSIIIGLFLFAFPKAVTNKLVVGTSKESDIDLNGITTAAYSVIGVYFIAFAVADLLYWASYYSVMLNELKTNEYFTSEKKVGVIVTFIELGIGLALLFGSNGINKLVLKVRTAGTN